MEFEKIKIELDTREIELLTELNNTENKISDLEAKNLSNDLMESIKSTAIETITTALGVSDILEKRAHSNGLEADKEYKNYLTWKDTPKEERSSNYIPKYLHKNEFNDLLNASENIVEYNKAERKKYEGKEFGDRKDELYRESGKPLSHIDAYTGNKIKRFDEDSLKSNVEHINPISQVHNDPAMQKYFSQKERKEYVNSKENTCLIRGNINRSKNGISLEETNEWANKNKERFDLDTDKIKQKVKEATDKKDSVLENKKISYKSKEQLGIAGSNALKSGAKAAIGQLLTITIVETIDEFKKDDSESDFTTKVKNISIRIKNRASELIDTFKDFSISAFISTFLDALLNSIFKLVKNIIKFIKTAVLSIFKAFKVLMSDKYSKEEKLVECRKILGVTVATLIGLALEEVIEKALISVFPFTAPFAGYISPVLSGLIVGIGSVMLMQYWEKNKDSIELTRLKGKQTLLLEKSSKISIVKAQISDVEATASIQATFTVFQGTLPLISSFKEKIDTSINNIKETKNKIVSKLDDISQTNEETDDLLKLLESL
ncbi:hypothetical protein G1K46_06175 [Tenacibaculum finnmarkense]|uniref:hypothetical protein n=1 Tax=Tenacibaculum finnmarkense TaxID=2781243 RepID=UPI001EFBCF62|nr:hypothetical protein [Tenacibaculum finnmarkense]MCG8732590.1 hypothetical protein [Tenacibaculum finnmarkense]MCG8762329.1 hypothetical protein [Tenacibaculum finnmarkense]MCG8787919.1 hypothetical protein [Tenacibaculum finnmarkense]WCC41874.1 hypothetical protein PJJ26_10450 [Tenacibaculum finnmarkense]